MDRDRIKPLLKRLREHFRRLSHLWLDAGYNGKGKGKDWVEKELELTAQVVRRPRRPRYVCGSRKEQRSTGRGSGSSVPEPDFKVLPRRWVVEQTFSWLHKNRRMT
jgi:putative transposase